MNSDCQEHDSEETVAVCLARCNNMLQTRLENTMPIPQLLIHQVKYDSSKDRSHHLANDSMQRKLYFLFVSCQRTKQMPFTGDT